MSITISIANLYGVQLPEDVILTLSQTALTLSPSASASISVNTTTPLEFTGSVPAAIRIRDTYGSFVPISLFLRFVPPAPALKAGSSLLRGTIERGSMRTLSFNLSNVGRDSTPVMDIQTPSLEFIFSPTNLGILAPGETVEVLVTFAPSPAMDPTIARGQIVVGCGSDCNMASVSVAFDMTIVSKAKFDLIVVVEDEYTYFTNSSPGVADASITIQSGTEKKTGVSDALGRIVFEDVREDIYEVRGQALGHESATVIVSVSEANTTATLFLPRAVVSYVWTVTPTTIEDEYTFELHATFEVCLVLPSLYHFLI